MLLLDHIQVRLNQWTVVATMRSSCTLARIYLVRSEAYFTQVFATISADVTILITWSCSSPTLPAKHYDADTTEPISCGLHTLEELLSWSQSDARSFNVATVPLSSRKPTLKRSPQRTLVSHDMMGGYLDDRWDGCSFSTLNKAW